MKTYRQILKENREPSTNEILNRFKSASIFSDTKNMLAFPDAQSRDSWIILRADNGKVNTFAFYPASEEGAPDDFEEFEMPNLDAIYDLGNEQLISKFISDHNITDTGTAD